MSWRGNGGGDPVELGRNLPPSDTARQEHLKPAADTLARAGAVCDLERAIAS